MAVQRNFVVRNGLEVNTSLVFTDTDNQRVGIGSTQPTTNLDVKLGGIAGTDLYMAGLSTFMNDLDCNASVVISAGASVAGFTTFTNIVQTGSGATVGFGTSVFITSGDLTIHSGDVVVGHGLSVSGIATFNGNIDANADLDVDGHTELDDVNVSGASTFVGVVTTQNDLFVGGDLFISENISLDTNLNILGIATIGQLHITGISSFDGTLGGENNVRALQVGTGISVAGITTLAGSGGITTTGGDLHVGGDLFIQDSVTLDTDLSILGVATVGILSVTNTSGINTFASTVESTSKDTGALVIEGGVGIEKQLYVGAGASVGTGLTVGGTLDANGDLDVDGHTELDDVNVSGVSTFVGFSTFNDYVFVQDGLNVAGVATATTFDGDVTGTVTGNITGVGTFTTLHVGTGGTVLQASEDGTIALGSGTTTATVTLNGGSIPSIGLVIALGG